MYPLQKKINRKDEFKHWPEFIKSTMQWFTFLEIMEYTGNDIKNDTPLTSSLLKMFSMFEIILSVGDVNQDEFSLKCINCKISIGLKTKSGKEFHDKMITLFVMNSMLHHIGMSWMIS